MRHFILAALTLSLTMAYGQVPHLGPCIYFESTSLDHGLVVAGQERFHFRYTNVGDEPLIISSVKSTSGSVTAQWSSDPVLPGQMEEIEVAWDTQHKQGGRRMLLTVTSNDLTQPELKIYICATIVPSREPELWAPQTEINLGRCMQGEAVFQFRCYNNGDAPLHLEVVKPSTIAMYCEYSEDPILPGEDGLVNCTWDLSEMNGEKEASVAVVSDTKGPPVHHYVVKATLIPRPPDPVWPEIAFAQLSFDAGDVLSGYAHQTASFKNIGHAPLQIQRVECISGPGKAKWNSKMVAPGDSAAIWLDLPLKFEKAGKYEASFRVITNDSMHPPTTLTLRANSIPSPQQFSFPTIRFDTLAIDKGSVDVGEACAFRFRFTNLTDSSMRITGVKPSSSAMKATFDPTPIPPGGHGEIIVQLNTDHHDSYNCAIVMLIDEGKPTFYTVYAMADVFAPAQGLRIAPPDR